MNVAGILARASAMGIHLSGTSGTVSDESGTVSGTLVVDSLKPLTEQERDFFRAHKAEILAYLAPSGGVLRARGSLSAPALPRL